VATKKGHKSFIANRFDQLPVFPGLFIYFPDSRVIDYQGLTAKLNPVFTLYLVCPLYWPTLFHIRRTRSSSCLRTVRQLLSSTMTDCGTLISLWTDEGRHRPGKESDANEAVKPLLSPGVR
jgi:hypothetical protein